MPEHSRLTSRKFILAMSAVLSASVLVGLHLIADGVYATIVVSTLTGYLTANVAQKRAV